MIAAVGYPQTATGVKLQRMRRTEFAVTHTNLPPLFDKRTIRRKLHHAGRKTRCPTLFHGLIGDHALATVPVRDIDAAIGANNHIIRLIKMCAIVAGFSGSAQA